MAVKDGAKFVLKNGATTIAGGRTLSLTVNGAAVDVQDQGSAGIQEFLADKITGQSLELSFEGLEDDGVLMGIALGAASGRFLTGWVVEFDGGGDIACNWFLSAFETTGEYEGAQSFTATLQSNGTWTYTP